MADVSPSLIFCNNLDSTKSPHMVLHSSIFAAKSLSFSRHWRTVSGERLPTIFRAGVCMPIVFSRASRYICFRTLVLNRCFFCVPFSSMSIFWCFDCVPFCLGNLFALVHTRSHFINSRKWYFGNGQFGARFLVKEIDITQLKSFQNLAVCKFNIFAKIETSARDVVITCPPLIPCVYMSDCFPTTFYEPFRRMAIGKG